MIDYIEGRIDSLELQQAVIEAGGIGYAVTISLNTYTALRGKERARLYIHEQVKQDTASQLYGFYSRDERALFLLLLSVNGVGGQTARSLVSAFTPSELQNTIASEDVRTLTSVKGLGKKGAERIIVELRDKVLSLGTPAASSAPSAMGAAKETVDEAVAALTMLGFTAQAAKNAATSIIKADPSLPVEAVIKQALKAL